MFFFFFQAEDGIRDHAQSRGLGDVYKRQVREQHIEQVATVPDIDKETLTVKTRTTGSKAAYVEAILKDGKKIVASGKAVAGSEILLSVKSPKLWDTHNPYLYDLEVVLYNNGKETDRIKSYAAMRKVSAQRDKDGFMRFQLNNKDIFHFGPLDQGWWPDGLYTCLLYTSPSPRDQA